METNLGGISELWPTIPARISVTNARIRVDTNALVSQADTVSRLCNDMTVRFDNIKCIMDKTKGYWLGEAGDLHRQSYEEQIENIQLMLRRLKEHPEDLLAITENYRQTETSNAEVGRGLPSNIFG